MAVSEVCAARVAAQADLSEERRPECPVGRTRLDPPAKGPVGRERPGERPRGEEPGERRGRHQSVREDDVADRRGPRLDRKSTRLNSSHLVISYAVFCLKKKKNNNSSVVSR